MESIQSLTVVNNLREFNYSWAGDSTTWSPWQIVGGTTVAPIPSISPSPTVEPFKFEPIELGPVGPTKEKKKKFLRLIRPIKE